MTVRGVFPVSHVDALVERFLLVNDETSLDRSYEFFEAGSENYRKVKKSRDLNHCSLGLN